MIKVKQKIPIILYEENAEGKSNLIPYIEVGLDEEMPKVLFISEYKQTGEFDVSMEHGSSEIVDMLIHKFVDMEYLMKILDEDTNDKLRVALGMKPLKEAQAAGSVTLSLVEKKAEERKQELQTNKDARAKRAFTLGEDFKKKAEAFLKKNKAENKD